MWAMHSQGKVEEAWEKLDESQERLEFMSVCLLLLLLFGGEEVELVVEVLLLVWSLKKEESMGVEER